MARSRVRGLGAFRATMAGLESSYVVIGGTACDVLLSDAGLPFRATHDIDIVLIADAHFPETARAFWHLVKEGGYRHGWKGSSRAHFYRFTEPSAPDYPAMLELFSRRPSFLADAPDAKIAPLSVDDEVSSLSAIFLDDDYYTFMLDGARAVGGVSVLGELYLIPFKAKAYLDLLARREAGEHVDTGNVRKHKRDVLRLAQLIVPGEHVKLPDSITADMRAFLHAASENPSNMRQLSIGSISYGTALDAIAGVYGLGPQDT